jgi:dihydroneopterin aldolase/2-amino-4-hydroxy-6-hydroxymethyldihydropteridine diphosphokinase
MACAFIGLGSNIAPAKNVARALQRLAQHGPILGISMVYRTAPEGRPEQPWYYNCVVALETQTPPVELKTGVLQQVEQDLGRVRTADKYAPRTIDLDLILYDDLVMESDDLRLPDPQILRRPFLARALYELAPELTLPGSNRRIETVAAALPAGDMEALPRFTERMRRLCHEAGPASA